MPNRFPRRLLAAAAALAAASAHAQVTTSPGFTTRTIDTPDIVAGGVVSAGDAVFVGQGDFGPGGQIVVRLDADGNPTTIATGFNSLGGFDWDGAKDTLYVVDNGGEQPGATSGDTVYAIPQASTRTTPVAAADVAVVPSGTIPFAQDVVVAPDGLLVSDGAGPGAGRVLHVVPGIATPLVGGLDYASGLALVGGGLDVANVDGAFVGSIAKYTLTGAPAGTLVGGLSGVYGLAVDRDFVLATGGVADDSSGTLVAVAPDGSVTERARGFDFSGDVHFDPLRGEALVLDFQATEITAVCRDDYDGDDSCDVCAGGGIEKAQVLAARLNGDPGTQKLVVKGQLRLAPAAAAAVDPLRHGVRIVVSDDTADPILDTTIPPGPYDATTHHGWRTNAAHTAFTWTSRTPGDEYGKVVVKANHKTGVVRIAASGRKSDIDVSDADFPLGLALVLAEDGGCGQVPPTPTATPSWNCVSHAGGNVVKCK
jgi:hypothetical protein